MASLKFIICLILVSLSFSKLETRPLEPLVERKVLSKSFRALLEVTKGLKVGVGRNHVVGNLYEDKQLSPSGPDPQHHFENLS
ncbi:hypothetical protein L1049_024934 [Liquidambar formosana]|uniref:Uncharacterized protein n=1 Tax=Liquidambar formosana TaxID=63359 RepID=A0AAP0RVI4_LIQFO